MATSSGQVARKGNARHKTIQDLENGFSKAPVVFTRGGWSKAVGSTAAQAYIHLLGYAGNDTGQMWPSAETLAEEMGKSELTVRRALKRLEQYDIIDKQQRQVEGGQYTTPLYTALHPMHWRPVDSPSELAKGKQDQPREETGKFAAKEQPTVKNDRWPTVKNDRVTRRSLNYTYSTTSENPKNWIFERPFYFNSKNIHLGDAADQLYKEMLHGWTTPGEVSIVGNPQFNPGDIDGNQAHKIKTALAFILDHASATTDSDDELMSGVRRVLRAAVDKASTASHFVNYLARAQQEKEEELAKIEYELYGDYGQYEPGATELADAQ